MTVSSSASRNYYSGNGATTVFAYTFKIFDESQVKVIARAADGTETVKTLTTHYTVSGVGTSGGNVTMLVAPASGTKLTLVRNVPLTQETDYTPNDPFPAESHEAALDKLTMLVQQLQEQVNRALAFSPSSAFSSVAFPDLIAGYYIRGNAAGTGLEAVQGLTAPVFDANTTFTAHATFENNTYVIGTLYTEGDIYFQLGNISFEGVTVQSNGTDWYMNGDFIDSAMFYNPFNEQVTKTSNYTLTNDDYTVLADTTAGSFNVTLLTAVGRRGRRYTVKCIGTSNSVTVNTTNSQQIDNGLTGGGTSVTYAQPTSKTFESNGTGWFIV